MGARRAARQLADERAEEIRRHRAEQKHFQDRINAMYVDKLDGPVDTAFRERMWNNGTRRKIAGSEKSNGIR